MNRRQNALDFDFERFRETNWRNFCWMRHKYIQHIHTNIQIAAWIADQGFSWIPWKILWLSRASLCFFVLERVAEKWWLQSSCCRKSPGHISTDDECRPGVFGVPTRVTIGTTKSDKTGNGIRPEAMPLPWSPGLPARTWRINLVLAKMVLQSCYTTVEDYAR